MSVEFDPSLLSGLSTMHAQPHSHALQDEHLAAGLDEHCLQQEDSWTLALHDQIQWPLLVIEHGLHPQEVCIHWPFGFMSQSSSSELSQLLVVQCLMMSCPVLPQLPLMSWQQRPSFLQADSSLQPR